MVLPPRRINNPALALDQPVSVLAPDVGYLGLQTVLAKGKRETHGYKDGRGDAKGGFAACAIRGGARGQTLKRGQYKGQIDHEVDMNISSFAFVIKTDSIVD